MEFYNNQILRLRGESHGGVENIEFDLHTKTIRVVSSLFDIADLYDYLKEVWRDGKLKNEDFIKYEFPMGAKSNSIGDTDWFMINGWKLEICERKRREADVWGSIH